MRWDDGGNGKSGSSFTVQWAGVHKAALNDYTVSSTAVRPVWFICQICNHEPVILYKNGNFHDIQCYNN